MDQLKTGVSLETLAPSGFTTYPIALTQNAWTKIVPHSNYRIAVHLQPTNPSMVITFGETNPTQTVTLPSQFAYTPNVLTRANSPALVRGPIWAWTSVAGNVVLVTEEMAHEL